jgi:hypothetical protein
MCKSWRCWSYDIFEERSFGFLVEADSYYLKGKSQNSHGDKIEVARGGLAD